MSMRQSLLVGLATFFTSAATSWGTSKADLILNLSTVVNGSTPSAGTPWATLDLHTVSTGDVELTIANYLSGSEFITTELFNVSGVSPSALTFTYLNGAATSSINLNSNGGNNIKAGQFSVDFEYTTAQGDRFLGGQTSVYDIQGPGITAQSFDVLSDADKLGSGGYLAAADVQGIPAGSSTASGSIGTSTASFGTAIASVPEPSTFTLGAFGILAAIVFSRRFGSTGLWSSRNGPAV